MKPSATLEPGSEAGTFMLHGRLDFSSVPELARRASELFAGAQDLHVDLSGVTHANSAGLALLLEWVRTARADGRLLKFEHIPDRLLTLARVSELDDLLQRAAQKKGPGSS